MSLWSDAAKRLGDGVLDVFGDPLTITLPGGATIEAANVSVDYDSDESDETMFVTCFTREEELTRKLVPNSKFDYKGARYMVVNDIEPRESGVQFRAERVRREAR